MCPAFDTGITAAGISDIRPLVDSSRRGVGHVQGDSAAKNGRDGAVDITHHSATVGSVLLTLATLLMYLRRAVSWLFHLPDLPSWLRSTHTRRESIRSARAYADVGEISTLHVHDGQVIVVRSRRAYG